MGALVYLTLCSLKNRLLVRVRRLREPRYAIGLVVGVAYFYFLFWRRSVASGRAPGGALAMMSRIRSGIELGAAGLVFLIAALAWVWPSRTRPALAFTRADVQFLFPAPFTRRQLIRYKIFRSQLGALIGSAIMTLFLRPTSVANGWMFFLGIAILMAVVNLHLTGVSLSRESLGTHGIAGLTRQWLPVVVVLGAVGVIIAAIAQDWPLLSSLTSAGETMSELRRLLSTGAAGIVLWPFRQLVALPLSETPHAFAVALPNVLLLGLLNYAWVLRSDASFEEASAELAEKVARIRRGPQPMAPRAKAMSTPFTLALDGPAETAILWKNLILVGRYLSFKTLARFLPLIVVFTIAFTRGSAKGGTGELIAGVSMMVFTMTVLMGPQVARNDLRQDLVNLAVLRTWPVRGATLVRGEMLAPASILTGIALCCWVAVMTIGIQQKIPAGYIGAAMLIAPGIILVQLLVQNGLAVMWPSWVVMNSRQNRGIDVMGQRMLMMVGLLLVLVIALLPAAVLAAVVAVPVYYSTGAVPVLIPALVAGLALIAEAFIGSEIVGKMLERTDVGQMDATES